MPPTTAISDRELLLTYLAGPPDSHAAFEQLVRRYGDLVYSSARRQLRDPQLAEEVTQAVFILLDRKAAAIKSPLGGWLIAATYYACRDARKLASRRRLHEMRAAQMKTEIQSSPSQSAWEDGAPHLDAALASLKSPCRDALVLRYFQDKPLADVGVALGISAEAARKRCDRAIAELRRILSVKTSAPASVSLASHLTTATQPAPAALLDSIISASGIAAKTSLAAVLAHNTAAAMTWAKYKIAAMILAATTIAGVTTGSLAVLLAAPKPPPPASPPAAHPSVAVSTQQSTTLPDSPPVAAPSITTSTLNTQIARWDVLLNNNGIDLIKQLNPQPLQTASKSYQPVKFDAAALRGALAQARATQDAPGTSWDMQISQDRGGTPYLDPLSYIAYDSNRGSTVIMDGSLNGTEKLLPLDAAHIRLKIDYPQAHLALREKGNDRNNPWNGVEGNQALQFEDPLAAGEAIAFLGDYTGPSGIVYHHVMVWEAFTTTQPYESYFQKFSDPYWWCANGPEGVVAQANAAALWASQATHPASVVPPNCQREIDGVTVRLTGLCRLDKWPLFWWDGQGMPVNLPFDDVFLGGSRSREDLQCYFEIQYDDAAASRISPSGHPGRFHVQGTMQHTVGASEPIFNRRAPIGIPVGPWEKVGDIARGQSIHVDGQTYRLRDVQSRGPNSISAEFVTDGDEYHPNMYVSISAEARDGTQLDPDYIEEYFVNNYGHPGPDFQGIPLDQVKAFHVWKRKVQWLTFDNLPDVPAITPRTDLTRDEIARAQAFLAQREKYAHP